MSQFAAIARKVYTKVIPYGDGAVRLVLSCGLFAACSFFSLPAQAQTREVHELKGAVKNQVALADEQRYLRGIIKEQITVTIDGAPPIVIRADEIESDRDKHLNTFMGNVNISRGEEFLIANRAVWSDETNTVELSGNVRITTPEFSARAERIVVNMDLQLAKIYDGRAFFPATNYYVSGALIERIGESTLRVDNGEATTCDGPNPAWTISADSITVTEGGYATATNMSFNSRYAPVFKAPYFVFPVKTERQSGFLVPYVGTSSRDGITASLPFFWATGENHDLTITPIWRDKRGLSTTLEGRYHLESGRGIWQATYLNDRKTQSYDYSNKIGQSKNIKERYWVRAQNDWKVGEWDISFDLDMVSDPLYLTEFRSDMDGFYASNRLFSDEFGRSFNEYLDPMRVSSLYAQKADYDTYFRGTVQYTDNLYSKKNYDTIQKMPSLYYSLVSRPWPDNFGLDGLENKPRLSMDMRYDYFYRTADDDSITNEKGHRVLLKPSMTWSSPVNGLATLQLTGDMEVALYDASGYGPSQNNPAARRAARHDGRDERVSGALEAKLSTTLNKVYQGGPGDALATRHQITPTVSLKYVESSDDQYKLPYWDNYDRRLSRRTVRYGLLNTFVKKAKMYDENGEEAGHDYFQFLKVGLWSSYEFKDNSVFGSRSLSRYYDSDYYGKGAGPVEIEVEAFFNPYFSARLLSAMNGRTGRFSNHDLSLRFQDSRGDSLTLTYDFDSPGDTLSFGDFNSKYEELRADLGLVINSEWTANISTRYDVRKRRATETHARVMYQAQCYGLGLIFSDTDNDRRVGVVIDLLGLGSINKTPTTMATPPQLFYK